MGKQGRDVEKIKEMSRDMDKAKRNPHRRAYKCFNLLTGPNFHKISVLERLSRRGPYKESHCVCLPYETRYQ